MDPPYKLGIEEDVLKAISRLNNVDEDTLIILEADIKTDFDFIEELDYTIQRVKNYKTNKHLFLTKN